MRSYPIKGAEKAAVDLWLRQICLLENIPEDSFALSETDIHMLIDCAMQRYRKIEDVIPYRPLRRADLVQIGQGGDFTVVKWNGSTDERYGSDAITLYARLSPRGRKLIEICLPEKYEIILRESYDVEDYTNLSFKVPSMENNDA